MFSFSTFDKEVKDRVSYGGNRTAAALLGEVAAQRLKEKGITKVVFDRGGYLFHGRIKALVESLKKGGIVL